MLSDAVLRHLCAHVWDTACKFVRNNPEIELPPMLHLIDRRDELQVFEIGTEAPAFGVVREALKRWPSTAFIMVCEALGAHAPAEFHGDRAKVEAWRRTLPANMADWPSELTYETLVLVGCGPDFSFHQMRDFKREGGRVEFAPESKFKDVENRFFRLRELLVRGERKKQHA